MGSLRLVTIALLLASPAFAQTYGVGRTPTPEEIRRLDISLSPTGEELPPVRGTAKEGANLFQREGCGGCHGKAGIGCVPPPELQWKKRQDVPHWQRRPTGPTTEQLA